MLSPQQIAARSGKLTASRIACLMRADKEAILRLYQEFIGDAVEEDLSKVWPVQLGATTEKLNLDWFEMKNGPLSRRGEVVVHPDHSWAAATLDAWCQELRCPVETKHVGGREPLEIIIERYQPQMQWQMFCTRHMGASECALSVIMGADEPIVEFIPYAPDYAKEMFSRGAAFMVCVKTLTPPVELDPVQAPVDAIKSYDMTGNNMWADEARTWLDNYEQGQRAEAAEKALKALVPADAKLASGYGVRITRNRIGRMSLREEH